MKKKRKRANIGWGLVAIKYLSKSCVHTNTHIILTHCETQCTALTFI